MRLGRYYAGDGVANFGSAGWQLAGPFDRTRLAQGGARHTSNS